MIWCHGHATHCSWQFLKSLKVEALLYCELGQAWKRIYKTRTTTKEPSEFSEALLGGLLLYILKSQWAVGRKLSFHRGRCFGGSTNGKKSSIWKTWIKVEMEAASIRLDPDLPLHSIPAWSLCTKPALSLWWESCLCSIANTFLHHLHVWVVINELPWACGIYLTGIFRKLTPASFSLSLGSLLGDSQYRDCAGILWVESKQISIKLYKNRQCGRVLLVPSVKGWKDWLTFGSARGETQQ